MPQSWHLMKRYSLHKLQSFYLELYFDKSVGNFIIITPMCQMLFILRKRIYCTHDAIN